MKSVIFDLDGTLADTSADLIAAANACFRTAGQGDLLDPIADAATAFGGGRAMLTLGFSRVGEVDDALIAKYYPQLLDHYERELDNQTVLYEGVEDTLQVLRDRGYAMGICTNKPYYLAQELVTRLGIRGYFGALLGADTLPVRKPDPEHLLETIRQVGGVPETSALIGDTVTDANTCKASGVAGVLVTFGPNGRDVSQLHHDLLLDHYRDLPDMLDDWQNKG